MGDIYDYRADMYYCLYCLQTDDLKAVVNHLRTDEQVSCIGLWGRSMGAVTWYYIHSTLCLRDIVVRITLQETFEMIDHEIFHTHTQPKTLQDKYFQCHNFEQKIENCPLELVLSQLLKHETKFNPL